MEGEVKLSDPFVLRAESQGKNVRLIAVTFGWIDPDPQSNAVHAVAFQDCEDITGTSV